jgi:hypothetical protein
MINFVSVFWRTSYQEPFSKILERDDMGWLSEEFQYVRILPSVFGKQDIKSLSWEFCAEQSWRACTVTVGSTTSDVEAGGFAHEQFANSF